jgi:mannose-6-phosphate isomerase
VVAEIQQNSDTTYRLYDWGRGRETHIADALAVLDFSLVTPSLGRVYPQAGDDLRPFFSTREGQSDAATLRGEVAIEQVALSPYFCVERMVLPRGAGILGSTHGETFEIFGVLKGSVVLNTLPAREDSADPVEEANPGSEDLSDSLMLEAVAWTLISASMGRYSLVNTEQGRADSVDSSVEGAGDGEAIVPGSIRPTRTRSRLTGNGIRGHPCTIW